MTRSGRLSNLWATALTVLSALSIATEALPQNASSTTSLFALPASVTHEYDKLNGFNIHYLLGTPPSGKFRDTIFLVHGFPDISYGWRNQFQMLMDLGLRVVAMDSIGYGQTDAPEALESYSFKQAADNVKALANKLGVSKIILGGHDWGGATVYAVSRFYPDLITHVFSIAVPYLPPSPIAQFIPADLISLAAPTLSYQKQFASGIIEEKIKTKDDIKNFINTMYMGTTSDGQLGFSLYSGVLFDRFSRVRLSPLLSTEDLEYYVTEYSRHGMKGPCNWYRTGDINAKQSSSLSSNLTISIPAMYIDTAKSVLIPPLLIQSAKQYLPHLTSRSVNTDHWAMLEDPVGVNKHIKEWIEQVVFGGKKKI